MSKELQALEQIGAEKLARGELIRNDDKLEPYIGIIKQALQRLESIDNANPSEALGKYETIYDLALAYCEEHNPEIIRSVLETRNDTIKHVLSKAQEQEKENELLKEIIKSFFDGGCPLHQYTDKEDVLTIEVDDDCSIMRLGEFKGVDLDKKLKEVLG